MSGIAGIYCLDGRPVDRQDLQKMVDILAHRGPDGAEIWIEGSIGFGHRMLWTTPESLLEKLPLIKNDLIITADARIDNREELKTSLNLPDRPLEKISDSEFILAAYEKWGEDCSRHLIGDFAFAIWDKQKQTLFCARDHIGAKPFYYYRSGATFVFSSEIKPILILPGVSQQINELKVAYHLSFFSSDRCSTFYKDISRLPAAHSLTINKARTKTTQYWCLDPSHTIRFRSDKEYVEAFREIFSEAVRCRLRSAFPIGTTLSGGLDSSSIACVAKQFLEDWGKTQLHTFSAIFPNSPEEDLKWIDERYYINIVQGLGGFQPHFVEADRFNPLSQLLWNDDEAHFAPNLFIHQELYSSAHTNGVRVFLDGLDGDSVVSYGWDRITELIYTLKWKTLSTELKSLSKRFRVPRKKLLWKYGYLPFIQQPTQFLLQWLGKTDYNSPYESVISVSLSERVQLAEKIQCFMKEKPALTFTARQAHWLALTDGLHQQALELTDKASTRFSLEARYPFYDRRLMEFCLALPSSQKLRQGWTRAILRHAMSDILPKEVQWRVSKGNLSSNFQRNFLGFEQRMIEETISESERLEKYINIPALQVAYQNYVSDPIRSKQSALTVFCAVTLACWLKQRDLAT